MEQLATASNRIFRFGPFELRTKTGELFKHGVRVRLQVKPLQALQILLENAGDLITREQLYSCLWPDSTFVDFEGGLNTAANRLRTALGDSAESPRYIETLPRLGYRFICPVVELGINQLSECHPPVSALLEPGHERVYRPQRAHRSRLGIAAVFLPVAMIAAISFYFQLQARSRQDQPIFRLVSFRDEVISEAHFAGNLKRVIYTTMLPDGQQETLAVSLDGANAIPAAPMSDSLVAGADVRHIGTQSVVEFPPGHQVYVSAGRITGLLQARSGMELAFIDHPVRDDSGGRLIIVDRAGHVRKIDREWNSIEGLAWSPSGSEVWFTASASGSAQALYAFSAAGKLRQISNLPSSLRLFDISPNGQVLISVENQRTAMAARFPGAPAEGDISYLDASHIDDMSADGQMILFTEGGEGGGPHYSAYTFDLRSHRATRFASGRGLALTPDKTHALTVDPRDRNALVLTDLRNGANRKIQGYGFEYQWARFLPDTQSLLVGGAFPDGPLTICRQNAESGAPTPIEAVPYMDYVQQSQDGTRIAGISEHRTTVYDLEQRTVLYSKLGGGFPAAWSKDSKELVLAKPNKRSFSFVLLNLKAGSERPWVTSAGSLNPGPDRLAAAVAAPEADAYAYSVDIDASRLYVVEGWS